MPLPVPAQLRRPAEAAHRLLADTQSLRIPHGARREIVLMLTGQEHTLDVTVEDNAALDIVCIQIADDVDISIRQRSTLGTNAKIHWHNVTLGGGTVEHDLISHIGGAGSESTIDWIFYGRGKERQKLSVRNIFDAPCGSGEITVHGVVQDRAQASFNGFIEITPKGAGTDTYLTEKVLMLDAMSKVDAVPGLEIRTNDVKASHSATVTRVSPEDLFYFASRGIGEKEARRMFVEGFLGVLVGKIAAKRTREGVHWEIARKICVIPCAPANRTHESHPRRSHPRRSHPRRGALWKSNEKTSAAVPGCATLDIHDPAPSCPERGNHAYHDECR